MYLQTFRSIFGDTFEAVHEISTRILKGFWYIFGILPYYFAEYWGSGF